MKEIEVKAKTDDLDRLANALSQLGCQFSKPIVQNDRIFIPKGTSVPALPGVSVLRIRQQDGKFLFTLKQAVSNQLDCVEKELGIDDPEVLVEIFLLLGFEESSQVKKVRQKCQYQGMEICLDKVEGLGSFIEVEKISDENAKDVQEELFRFLQTLGIQKEDQVFFGYDVLLSHQEKK